MHNALSMHCDHTVLHYYQFVATPPPGDIPAIVQECCTICRNHLCRNDSCRNVEYVYIFCRNVEYVYNMWDVCHILWEYIP